MIDDWYQFSVYYVFPIVLCALYLLYYRKFAFFKIVQDFDPKNIRNKLARGKCPPSYPNGWYVLSRSNLIKQGQVMEIKLCGRHIVYYRGEDNVVYAVSSYCTHMGANLGYGGKVKNKTCIEYSHFQVINNNLDVHFMVGYLMEKQESASTVTKWIRKLSLNINTLISIRWQKINKEITLFQKVQENQN